MISRMVAAVMVMVVVVLATAVTGRPQGPNQGRQLQPQQNAPMNYNFQWEVDEQDYDNYYGHQETADNGRVDGSYHVWLPDGRLMKVTYYVDGESGFVPTITYEDNYTPTWGTSYFGR